MTSARIALIVPARTSALASAIYFHGGTARRLPANMPATLLPSVLAGLVGERIDVSFTGNGAAGAVDALSRIMAEEDGVYLSLVDARFDPSMCLPVHARVAASVPGMSEATREASLPFRFTDPDLDPRTLTEAFGAGDASVVSMAFGMVPAADAVTVAPVVDTVDA